MNQQKIGAFLKELRSEKALTQEQLAEHLNVSRRTVSRWKTGSNLPDLSVLVELADYYEVDLRQLLDGERKREKMNKELEETVHKVADYSNAQEQKLKRRINRVFLLGVLAFILYIVMLFLEITDKSPTYEAISSFALGLSFGTMLVGVLMTSRFSARIQETKMKLFQKKNRKRKFQAF
ncbi:transcriptional regulator with XRE-family HTH domain [Lachnospiraceae bacterium PF1-21]